MFSFILLGFLLIITIYLIFLIPRRMKNISLMTAMMVAMTIAMISSLYFGTILGVIAQHRMLEPTIFAVIYGMLVGYFVGKPFHLLAVLDGMLAGIMGGMMGAMLGVMVLNQSPEWILALLGVIFLLILLILIHGISRKTGNEEGVPQKYTWWVILPIVFFMIGFLIFSSESRSHIANWCQLPGTAVNQLPPLTEIKAAEKNGVQEIQIHVQANGYFPNQVKAKAGVPVKLRFINHDPSSCASSLVMENFGIRQFLKQGETVIVLPPQPPGTYLFHCEMNMFSGKIIVEP
ncbi:cupredoxin domain-containing protein [Thermoflavimicrobium dichotomicum]|uniref:cupredoxin domain-containing protein n=1 Tax=Thermoflavimicrobium dichotomicum TaxID=46223 RepID=UPI001587E029|nr:cupredoxin domain-containing protein [Thermoflavimicrobium dichotomicum]